MRKTLIALWVVLVGSSCGEPCQEFSASDADSRAHSSRLGLGYEVRLVIGSGVGPFRVSGALPPGLSLETSAGKILVVGSPTETGNFVADVRPEAQSCEQRGTRLSNMVLDFTVVAAECDNALACRLLRTTSCTQSSTCVPSAFYASAACVKTLGDTGGCVDVLGPADQCSGSVAAMTVATVEGMEIRTCVVTPAVTGCNNHVCYGPPPP